MHDVHPAAPGRSRSAEACPRDRYLAALKQIAERGGGHIDADTYVAAASYDAALLAAGGVVELVGAVLSGRARNGIALVRPPGHHATRERGMGFCLLNNVAAAAQAALTRFGLSRCWSWTGTCTTATARRPSSTIPRRCSSSPTHQYPYYPGSGDWRETGVGAGQGYTVNVPLPAGVGDAGFRRVYAEILAPLARRFRPDLIMVSAGYDAHWNDPLAGLASRWLAIGS